MHVSGGVCVHLGYVCEETVWRCLGSRFVWGVSVSRVCVSRMCVALGCELGYMCGGCVWGVQVRDMCQVCMCEVCVSDV